MVMANIISQSDWLATPLGAYLQNREQAMYDSAVGDIFGFNAVQLGLIESDLLKDSRMPFRCKVAPGGDVGLRCDFEQLPLASNSIDLLLLPHLLEYAANPHQVLREAERTLVPEGHLIISGFNPYSLWGLRRLYGEKKNYPWHGRFISLKRLKDWLALLALEVVGGHMACYAPPVNRENWLNRLDWMNKAGDRWWPMMGGVYFLTARKRVTGMRLIRPQWNATNMAQLFVPKPTQKTECQNLSADKSNDTI
jgi:SAM-dependent methyltransferase